MEQSEFRALAQAHQDMVYRIALNFFRNPQDAEDVTQDVLLRLYLRQEPFDGPDHPRSWLIQVTLNRCRSLWRAPWRRRQVPLDELTAAALGDLCIPTNPRSASAEDVKALLKELA